MRCSSGNQLRLDPQVVVGHRLGRAFVGESRGIDHLAPGGIEHRLLEVSFGLVRNRGLAAPRGEDQDEQGQAAECGGDVFHWRTTYRTGDGSVKERGPGRQS